MGRPLRLCLLLSSLSLLAATTVRAADPQPPVIEAAPPDASDQLCISARFTHQTIMLVRGRQRIELSLGGGACEPPGSGISDLMIRFPTSDSPSDVVLARTCPAFQAQITKLWASRRHARSPRQIRAVRVGPFVFSGRSDLFEVGTASGQSAAVRWVRQTLRDVRPCWNNFRQDRTLDAVDRLYAAPPIRPR
jgi:hypothetical protein